MTIYASLTRISGNAKTGPMPVSTTSKNSCPDACAFKVKGCYASYGPAALHWRKVATSVDDGGRGKPWAEFCQDVKALPRNTLWRHNQAGDLPGDGITIDRPAMLELLKANHGKRGFTYTHYTVTDFSNGIDCINAAMVMLAIEKGFTVNLSGNTLAHADQLKALGLAPVVVVLPRDAENVSYTPNGHKVVACPAEKSDKVNCANCALCQDAQRDYIIGFRAHGTAAKSVELIARG